jgi:hypothetical protein
VPCIITKHPPASAALPSGDFRLVADKSDASQMLHCAEISLRERLDPE